MLVGKICDEGSEITFNRVMAIVRNKHGDELCRFHGSPVGLFLEVKVERPCRLWRAGVSSEIRVVFPYDYAQSLHR